MMPPTTSNASKSHQSLSQQEFLAHWPLHNIMRPLGALPTAPAAIRVHVRSVLLDWCLRHLLGDTELVVGELAANAVNASTGASGRLLYIDGRMPLIQARVLCNEVTLRLEVWDQAEGIPVLSQPANLAEAGRGLAIVATLSERWGYRSAPNPPGKVVWAELRL